MALNPSSSHGVGGALATVASTGNAGYALTGGTGTILSYTTPDDGALHPVVVTSVFRVEAFAINGATVSVNIGDTLQVVTLTTGPANGGAAKWQANDSADGSGASFAVPANTLVTVTQDVGTPSLVTAYIEILSA